MNTPHDLCTRVTQTTAFLVLAMALLVIMSPAARAEVLDEYSPRVLVQAEQALAQGQPDRALALLHRQRAILSHGKFRAQGQALTCEAYLQQGNVEKAQQICAEVLAYTDKEVEAER